MNGETVILMVAVDVDDLLVVGGAKEAADFHETLKKVFSPNITEERSWNTGCAFERVLKQGDVKPSQTSFVEELLKRL